MCYKKNLDFVALILEDLAYQIDNIDSKKQDKIFYPRFTKIIIHHFLEKDKSILMRNRMFMYTTRDDSLLVTMRFVSRHAYTQVYGAILPRAMTNQALLDSVAYKTYYATVLGAEPLISRKSQKKSDSAISSEESPSKKKSAKAKKVATPKPKPTKKKALIKANRGKGLNWPGDGTDFESGVPNEQHLKITGADEGTGTILGVPNVPKYNSKSEKESWGDNEEEDKDDENDSKDKSNDGDDDDGNDVNDGNDDDDDANDDDNQEEEENIDDEEIMDDEEDDEVTKELYKDVNLNLGNEDTEMTNADQGGSEQQNVSQESGRLINHPSPADNEIALLMETSARHATSVPVITSGFTTTIPPPPPFGFLIYIQVQRQSHQLKKDLSVIKQVDQYAQALSFIPSIVDRYIDNKLGEALNKAIQAHNLDYRQEAQDEKNEYIGLILPQAVSDFATLVIEKNITESSEAAILARPSSQLKSTYEAAASLFEFELTKILLDKMEESKSHLRAD
ncbi:hypothetical protein Tco_0441482 [Tanacetum coccineum]